MGTMLLVVLSILGIVILVAGLIAANYLMRAFSSHRGRGWLIAGEVFVAVTGLLLGCFLFSVTWPYSATARIVGFPFFSAVWELSDGRWLDFVGPLTFPAAVGNFLVGFLLPHILFAIVVRWLLRRSQHVGKEG